RIIAAMRDWVDKVQEESRFDGEPPSAFMAIAFWPGGDEPWRLPYQIGWDTIEATLPLPLLTELGPAQLKTECVSRICEGRIMNQLGYEETPGDDPDDAA
ncbi:MAG TPA: hypothetical protein VE221_07965, partial [Sphingomicrobium sp.]|nr:hypothetical protein [Sphingomicrobium sp.]